MDAPLILLAVLALFAGPILAIVALVSVRRLSAAPHLSLLQELTTRVYQLERQVAQLAAPPAQPGNVQAPTPATEPPGIVTPPAVLPPPRPAGHVLKPPSPASRVDMETLIGGRWFYLIGIVALLIAISLGVKYAFDNKWIGPTGRVALGILLGALMLPWSQWLLGRGYRYFSEGIAALGEASLFVSVWAGCQYYSLYTRDVGFVAMIAITAVMAAIAVGRDSQRIAVMSLLGGLFAPILASSGKDEQVVLFAYLLVLGAGALLVAAKKAWGSLPVIAFLGTQIYFWGWYNEFFHRTSPVERTVLFATVFFLLYAALPLARATRGAAPGNLGILLLLANEFLYSAALFILLWPDDRWPLTLLFVALAAAHVAAARLVPAPKAGESGLARLLYAGLALTYLTVAIPVRLEGKWITFSFAVEGAILVWTGFRAANRFLRQAAYLLLAISALRLLVFPPEGGAFLFNPRFAAFLVIIACFAVALWSAQAHKSNITGQERVAVGLFAVAINAYALVALSAEFWDYFGKGSIGIEATLAEHLALSILWTVYASALLYVGVRKTSGLLRWQSLALFGLTVGKVFLYDLGFLDRGYRIFSFFVLGAVLLAVSFLYQRRLAREKGNT